MRRWLWAVPMLSVAGILVPAVPAASAVPAPAGCRTGADDFDGNGGADLAIQAREVGDEVDRRGGGNGAVAVYMREIGGLRRVDLPQPAQIGDDDVRAFGRSMSDVDLSDHSDPAQPCADLAVGAVLFKDDDYVGGAVFLYRWSTEADGFELLNTITGADIDPSIGDFGEQITAPTMPTDRPTPRAPVLYVSGTFARPHGLFGPGNVTRLELNSDGQVVSHEVIAPGATATAQMPLTEGHGRSFGYTLIGTPDPDQVIIGAPGVHVPGQGQGAVLVWNRNAASQVLTARSLGVLHWRQADSLGDSMWLSTEVANASHTATKLFIGVPFYSLPNLPDAGAAVELHYDRSTSPARIVTSSVKAWTQDSKGVAGKPDRYDTFGWSFQALTRGKKPIYLVGVPDERSKSDRGAIDTLGNGKVFYDSTVGHAGQLSASAAFGYTMTSWHDVDDRMSNDPFPAAGPGMWSRDVVVAEPRRFDDVIRGLPYAKNKKSNTIKSPWSCPQAPNGGLCEFGWTLTSTGGGAPESR
jgi:hypothetical protein